MADGVAALRYAEETLGVHSTYIAAQNKRNALDTLFTELSAKRDAKRDLEYRLHDAEMEVAYVEYGKHSDMAQTRMDKHLKVAVSQNDECRELREQLSKVIGDIEGLDFDRAVIETDIKIAVARLQELGGYLTFLAAVKQADKTSEANEAKENQA